MLHRHSSTSGISTGKRIRPATWNGYGGGGEGGSGSDMGLWPDLPTIGQNGWVSNTDDPDGYVDWLANANRLVGNPTAVAGASTSITLNGVSIVRTGETASPPDSASISLLVDSTWPGGKIARYNYPTSMSYGYSCGKTIQQISGSYGVAGGFDFRYNTGSQDPNGNSWRWHGIDKISAIWARPSDRYWLEARSYSGGSGGPAGIYFIWQSGAIQVSPTNLVSAVSGTMYRCQYIIIPNSTAGATDGKVLITITRLSGPLSGSRSVLYDSDTWTAAGVGNVSTSVPIFGGGSGSSNIVRPSGTDEAEIMSLRGGTGGDAERVSAPGESMCFGALRLLKKTS